MALITRIGKFPHAHVIGRIVTLSAITFGFSFSSSAQFPTMCTAGGFTPTVHAEGLAEQTGAISLTCGGGTPGTLLSSIMFVQANATITNRLDANGNPLYISVTINTGGGAVSAGVTPKLTAANTLMLGQLQYTIPANAAQTVTINISGIRVAMPTVTDSTGVIGNSYVTATIEATNLSINNDLPALALAAPTLLSSVVNNGVPCTGSPLPPTLDFPTLISTGTFSSTVRVTEGYVSAFLPKDPADQDPADTGLRFLVNISGYPAGARVFVADAIVGNRGTNPTTAGAFNTPPNGGTYAPNSNQLLLVRVNGADATGTGGTLALSAPGSVTSFTSVTELPLTKGAAYATYEVVDGNPNLLDYAQVPVFVVVPATSCSTMAVNTLGAMVAPVSNVVVPTSSAPIPRFIATPPASDCTALGDCSASYFPQLQVNQSSITLNGSSLGVIQSAFIQVGNSGSSQMTFNVSTTYQPGANQSTANWLSVSPTTGIVNAQAGVPVATLALQANPAMLLVPGAYQATVTIDAGNAGMMAIPVTFNVSPAGPVVQSVVNAANFQQGPVTANSFVAIYGLNLVAKSSLMVTFNGFQATTSFNGAVGSTTQINALVPAALGSAANAGLIVTVDGAVSNTFPVTLTPNAPAIFTPGIENQDYSINSPTAPASVMNSEIVQVFLTGLTIPYAGTVSVTIGGSMNLVPVYFGNVTSIPGMEQVNVRVPAGLAFTGGSAPLSVCLTPTGGTTSCSPAVSLYLH
jgi:uncharacterized protein (TIGR03437 family)